MKDTFSKQLTASLCHEVMTPLNLIINGFDILRMNIHEGQAPKERQRGNELHQVDVTS